MVWIRLKLYSLGIATRLQAHSAGAFKILKQIGSNANMIHLLISDPIPYMFERVSTI